MNKCRKSIIGLKKLKIYKREKKKSGRRKKKGKKGKLHRTAKPIIKAEVYNDNKMCD